MGVGKKGSFILCMISHFSFIYASATNPNYFEETKAEDLDSNLNSNELNYLPSCDLTPDYCDVNCCDDKDCTETEKVSFLCSAEDYTEYDYFKHFSCKNIDFYDYRSPFLCLEYMNSPYLGDFYMEDDNISGNSFSQIMVSRNKYLSTFKIVKLPDDDFIHHYKYGSKMFFLDNYGDRHFLNMQSNIVNEGNGYCSYIPMKFLINQSSHCFHSINEEQCLLNTELHTQQHINALERILYLGDINNVNITYNIVCLRDGSAYILLPKNHFKHVNGKMFISDVTECGNDISTRLNKGKALCENVVVGIYYTINVNGTLLLSIDVVLFAANIPINMEGFVMLKKELDTPFNDYKKNNIHMMQKTTVEFKDLRKDQLKTNGYKIGQPLYSYSQR